MVDHDVPRILQYALECRRKTLIKKKTPGDFALGPPSLASLKRAFIPDIDIVVGEVAE